LSLLLIHIPDTITIPIWLINEEKSQELKTVENVHGNKTID